MSHIRQNCIIRCNM